MKKKNVDEQSIVVLDTETTGMELTDQVCEMAWRVVNVTQYADRRVVVRGPKWSSLIKPTCSVSPEGRAAHHISDAELADAPTMERMLELYELVYPAGLAVFQNSHSVLAAHNLEFDLRMLLQSGVPESMLPPPERRICTVRCARHLYSDTKHGNQVLRYHLGLEVPELSGPMHRAMPDAEVTASLVMHMLETHSVSDLIRLTSQPVLINTCHIGKNAGTPWCDVDLGMLRWVLEKGPRRKDPSGGRDVGFDDDTRYTCMHWYEKKTGRKYA